LEKHEMLPPNRLSGRREAPGAPDPEPRAGGGRPDLEAAMSEEIVAEDSGQARRRIRGGGEADGAEEARLSEHGTFQHERPEDEGAEAPEERRGPRRAPGTGGRVVISLSTKKIAGYKPLAGSKTRLYLCMFNQTCY
jgi:hypothetical protein